MHNGGNHNASTPSESLTIIKLVDGAGSGLDADLLDGISSASFALAATTITPAGLATGGGSLAANRTITVAAASDAEARAQADTSKALTPANLAARASFRATKGGVSQTGVASVTYTKCTFTTEDWDIGSYYDAPNSKWIPPAGKVRLSASIFFSGDVTALGYAIVKIYKNGSALVIGSPSSATQANEACSAVTYIDAANGTDEYEVYGFVSAATTGTFNGAVTNSIFCGEQI